MPVIFPPEGHDALLEWAARHIEEKFPWFAGVSMPERAKGERENSKRRMRAREDIELAATVAKDTRRKCAAELRGFLGRPEMAAIEVLKVLAQLPDDPRKHTPYLTDAWPLAWGGKGWVRIECILCLTDNTIPPRAEYRITVTERGHKALAEHLAASAATSP